jgi:hypothetical protein
MRQSLPVHRIFREAEIFHGKVKIVVPVSELKCGKGRRASVSLTDGLR